MLTKHLIFSYQQRGISLVEILIGLSIGLVLTFGMVIFYSNTSKVSNETLATTRLEYELQTAMKMMKDDIRRAGFNAAATSQIGTGTVNPFMVSGTSDISLTGSNCILFTYDLNRDGTLPALGSGTSDERFGYRLNGTTIQSRSASDARFSCNAGSWENLTNPNLIQITALVFSLTEDSELLDPTNPGGATIRVRQVTISLRGQLSSNNAIQRQITSQVRVRNDKYQP